MNCHGNHNDSNQENQTSHKGKKHMIWMIVCCLIPVALLMILPLFNMQEGAFKNLLPVGIFLLCPLMHIVMMGGMMKLFKKQG